MDYDNIFRKLENLKVPVSEKEWAAIAGDPAIAKMTGRKPLPRTAKGIAAAVSGIIVAAALVFAVRLASNIPSAQESTAAETRTPAENTGTADSAETTIHEKGTARIDEHTAPALNFSAKNTLDNKPVTEHNNQTAETGTPEAPPAAITPNTAQQPQPATTPHAATTPTSETQRPALQEKVSTNVSPTAETSETTVPTDFRNDVAAYENPDENTAPSENQFFVPSAFTPNGDGLNDVFLAKANFEPKNFEIMIFGRNGDLVFRSNNINNGWDGTFRGKTLPQGVYLYTIRHKNKDNKEEKLQGQILLIP